MSRNADYMHLKLKSQMDGLKGKPDKAREGPWHQTLTEHFPHMLVAEPPCGL